MDTPKKLVLSTETLRTLDEAELTDVVGGATGICVNTVVCHSGICNVPVNVHSVICNSGAVCQSAVC